MLISEYAMNKSSMLLLCGWAKTGRGDGITGSGVAAPFLLPLTNSVQATKDIVAEEALQQKCKGVKMISRTSHRNP